MKSIKSLLILPLLAIILLLCSFVAPSGGEVFEIYLDNTLLIQKFNNDMKKLSNLSLNTASPGSEIKVRFYHCGLPGRGRTLSLKNHQNEVLKQWQFRNSDGKNFAIAVPVKEIIALQEKAGNATIYLYYSSKEVHVERLLTGIIKKDKALVSIK